jgi:hypothetical protein
MQGQTVMTFGRDDLTSGLKLGVTLGAAAVAVIVFLRPASTGPSPNPPVAAVSVRTVAAVPAATTVSAMDRASAAVAAAELALSLSSQRSSALPQTPRVAVFGSTQPSAAVRGLADWIADSRDNGDRAFLLVDKRKARLHVFDADANWVASTPVLLGAALGDESVPGIGSRPMSLIRASERTTPAGRFVGERGRNAAGEDIVWVDYDAAVSMHRVRLVHPSERRAERLASPTAADNRISYGCINVPAAFYERHVQTVFASQAANIYVLPDVRPLSEVFQGVQLPTRTAAAGVRTNRPAAASRRMSVRSSIVYPRPLQALP